MPARVSSTDLVHTVDAIELPPLDEDVFARAGRHDSYPIVVTRSPEETARQLLRFVGDANVAVITDETVAALYGPLVVDALEETGTLVEVTAVPAGERNKTLGQAFELLDWLTGTHAASYVTGQVMYVDGGVSARMSFRR